MTNPGNIIGGHKATLNNPNTPDGAKQHSREVLENAYDGGNVETHSQANKYPINVAGGLKATINNSTISEKAKESVKERLDQI